MIYRVNKKKQQKLSQDAEYNTFVATADSKDRSRSSKSTQLLVYISQVTA